MYADQPLPARFQMFPRWLCRGILAWPNGTPDPRTILRWAPPGGMRQSLWRVRQQESTDPRRGRTFFDGDVLGVAVVQRMGPTYRLRLRRQATTPMPVRAAPNKTTMLGSGVAAGEPESSESEENARKQKEQSKATIDSNLMSPPHPANGRINRAYIRETRSASDCQPVTAVH
jgi:hypothetical protein